MLNTNFNDKFGKEGLTFDDVLLIPGESDVEPKSVDVSTNLTKTIRLNTPLMTAAMDTVTETAMAIAIAREGGVGVIHKNMAIERQADMVDRVKRSENGVIVNPFFLSPENTVKDADDLMGKYKISGVPICRDGKLIGIITNRDMRFMTAADFAQPISTVMTQENLITAPVGTTLEQAQQILREHKIEKLPIVGADGSLKGLITIKDIEKSVQYPNSARDDKGRLLCGAAIGATVDVLDRVAALIEAGVDLVVLDSAHGHNSNVVNSVARVKNAYPNLPLVAGNIATAEAAKALINAGADAVKVGIGPGSICTTRVVAGVGTPQVSAIYEAYKAIGEEVPIIADGGIKQSGDVPKAIAVGASCVMMGSVLAGTLEGPGEKTFRNGRRYVLYRGMGSLVAMQKSKGSRERYGQKDTDDVKQIVPQGVEGMVPYRGSLSEVLCQFIGGLRYSLGYCGTKTIPELRARAKVTRVSPSALKEAHPHDIIMTRDAPNYMQEN